MQQSKLGITMRNKWLVSWFDCDESLTCRGLNSNPGQYRFYLYLCSYGESCLLASWYVGDRCGMVGSDENHSRSRKPGVDDRGWSHRSGTR
jgi:hypothetical protein